MLEGFCAYANVVIAARFAQREYGIKRVMIADWDCHHGNGTVFFTCNDTSVLFCETASVERPFRECNKDKKHIISVAVGGQRSHDDFVNVWKETLIPAADAFKPELVLVSSGFDIKRDDPVCGGRFKATARTFSALTRLVMDVAEKHCNGKLVTLLEGGYRNRGTDQYRAIAECASSLLATLISGEEQPESAFYREIE